ncbi:hypothetical protein BKA61DRAFT_679406 [Leptodontidium sp. MPI-SDFR-AT-0119]|nr:hypothetical protein BKA61DRAFT_679406 [Leptodontidium sp. MPI-SDFR-AT-0119]
MTKPPEGFNQGSGAVSCAYWKVRLLRDTLLAAGVSEKVDERHRRWANFEGTDEQSEGKYATCISLDNVMNAASDFTPAYEMKDVSPPLDHVHPARILIPGCLGGRRVKW